MLKYSVEKLHAKKLRFWETGITSWWNKKNLGKIGFAFSMLVEWWKLKMFHWLTMRHCVWMRPGMIWWCGEVPCKKNYLPPSGNEEYLTTASQCKTLLSRMLCWFAYFAASRVCWRSVIQSSIEYRISIELECYHSYNNYHVLITRMVSLLSPCRCTHCLPNHILLAVLALQGFRDWLIFLPH